MRELIACWRHTRMVVLTGFCAALFVAVLLPFKIATIVPGITEVRPAAALPVLFSIFFGPAAAWGSAFGNLIGDVLGGTIGPGSLFGFMGNLVYGFAPYRLFRMSGNNTDYHWSARKWFTFVIALTFASALCASIIALGVDVIGIPFAFLVHTIFLNNMLVGLILVPLLHRALGKRIHDMKLGYDQILSEEEISKPVLRRIGVVILLIATLIFYAVMMVPDLHQQIPSPANAFKVGFSVLLTILAIVLL